jgi:hypothetical protein
VIDGWGQTTVRLVEAIEKALEKQRTGVWSCLEGGEQLYSGGCLSECGISFVELHPGCSLQQPFGAAGVQGLGVGMEFDPDLLIRTRSGARGRAVAVRTRWTVPGQYTCDSR